MKKFMVFMFAVAMTITLCGTATAAVVKLENVYDYIASPVSTGDTVYILGSAPVDGDAVVHSGATLLQVNPTTGNSCYFVGGFNKGWGASGGASAYGTPVLYQASGDSGVTLVMNVYPRAGTYVAEDLLTGTSLWAVYFGPTKGMGVTNWGLSLDYRWAGLPKNKNLPDYMAGATGWTTHLTIDTASNGTSVYGTSGVSCISGASIWAISLGAATKSVQLSNNRWSAATSAGYGVSTFVTPPVITGNSLFVLASYDYNEQTAAGSSGVSLLAFDKRNLHKGPYKHAKVLGKMLSQFAATPWATPALSGNSLFVLDSRGGLTAYNIATLTSGGARNFRQLAPTATTSVTASPVCTSVYLVAAINTPTGAGITCFTIGDKQINAGSGVSWWFEFGTGTTISSTPAISNGNVYVAVNDSVNDQAVVHRFTLAKGNAGKIAASDQYWATDTAGVAMGFVDSGLIVVNEPAKLMFISNHNNKKRLYTLDVSSTAYANSYWRQFKYNAAKTGENTKDEDTYVPGDSGGCFISTIK